MRINLLDYINYTILTSYLVMSSLAILSINSNLYNINTYLYNLLIISILFAAYIFSKGRCHNIVQVLCILFYIYILPRLTGFAILPELVNFPHAVNFTVDEINKGLSEFIMFLTMFLLGILVLNKRKIIRPYSYDAKNLKFVIVCLFLIFCLAMTFEYQVFSREDVSVYSLGINDKANLPMLVKVLTVFISSDVILFFILFFAQLDFDSKGKSTADKIIVSILVIISILIYIYVSTLLGSRGAGVRIILFTMAIFLVLKNDVNHIKIFCRSGTVVTIAICISFFAFPVGEKKRTFDYNSHAPAESHSRESHSSKGINPVAIQLFNRLGILDYFIITLAREPKISCKEKYLTFSYSLKSVANFVMPGDPFQDAKLKTPEIFGICYSDKTPETMVRRTSELWTLPGISKHHLGSWSYVGVFIAGVLLAFGSISLISSKNGLMHMIYGFYIFIMPYLVFFSMGIDHTLNTMITFFLRLSLAAMLIQIIFSAEQRIRKLVR